ncbi:glycosyltransferase [Candidatus Sumerlaeota bacterium]|nr:glycosyltransferase [Candidatus Sumerlaeota bacterium]MBI3736791.1 glycosyltransferase [Candidatus Sumerlaeota bacterium]
MDYGIIIANWNGGEFVERCLGSVLTSLRHAGNTMRVLVVDDASADDSPDRIARLFPSVELLRLKANVGFGEAVNTAMKALDTPWVFLLNNDLLLAPDFLQRLVEARVRLADNSLFCIGAQTLTWDSLQPNHAGMNARWAKGRIIQCPFRTEECSASDFVQGGACLYDREKFLSLGGFCSLYHPGYWEDYDLAYQALRRGWNNYYEPRAKAYHWGKKSMRSLLGEYRLALTIKRNHLLFVWVNLSDFGLLCRHLMGLAELVARGPGDVVSWHRALWAALGRLPAALRERRKRRRAAARSDRQILKIGK